MSETRRILSIWFPRLAAERLIRHARLSGPVAVVVEAGNRQCLAALSAEAEAAGLAPGQPLSDALALCPALLTRPADPVAEALFLARLRRWAGKVSPWVGELPPDGLAIDITGSAHLFGGEAGLMAELAQDLAGLGLSAEMGLADTPGAAWALARFAGRAPGRLRSGDDIAQEARATRSRAARRHWVRGGQRPVLAAPPAPQARVAAPGQTRQALAPLPIAALRLPSETVTALARVGLGRIEDLLGLPRAALARRYGLALVRRLDQALGMEAEPVAAPRPAAQFATRLTFPEPIGLAEDILAGIDRLLPPLAAKLAAAGRGVRRLRLQAFRSDHRTEVIEVGLARPSAAADDIRPLLAMKVETIDPGLGIDCLRLEAPVVEPLPARQIRGPLASGEAADRGFDLMIARIGARIGMEALTRHHPGDSHIPEKAAQTLAAAWSEPAGDWPAPLVPRPLSMFPPEPVACAEGPAVPKAFRWRRRDFTLASATGPERIAPEWWLDEPAWRSGPRDYWRVETTSGTRLWLYYAHGGAVSGGWFCHGEFA
jgi:protein ImuB